MSSSSVAGIGKRRVPLKRQADQERISQLISDIPKKEYQEDLRVKLGMPRISLYKPHKGDPGSELYISGRNLSKSKVMLGNRPAKVLSSSATDLIVEVPSTLRPGIFDLLVWNYAGCAVIKKAFTVLRPAPSNLFTFSAPVNPTVAPSQLNQKFLVLMVLPADGTLPSGMTEATMQADLISKLSGPGKCVNGFWQEASYGKASFIFDVYEKVITLANNKFDCFHAAQPKRIDGMGVTFPITWAGGETLDLAGANSFSTTVEFLSGDQTLDEIVAQINATIDQAWNASSEAPIIASDNAGQIRLESAAKEKSAVLEVAGGTAVDLLGLSNPIVTAGIDGLDRRYEVFVEAMEKRTENMSEADAQAFLAQYAGVIVSYAVGEGFSYYRANAATWTFNVRGGSFELGNVYITNGYPWQVFAHETGHTLGLPDLYDEPGLPELVGEELGAWDIMAGGWQDAHPSAWNKAERTSKKGSSEAGYNDPWIPASTMHIVTAPPPGKNIHTEALLLPLNTSLPAINPFAASHPGIPLVHAARIDFDQNHALYVEARDKGPFVSTTLGSANYDSEIPAEGVIVTDAINDLTGIPIYRANDTLLTPYGDPIDIVGESYDENISVTSKLSLRCLEVITGSPTVYRLGIDWGPGSFFDLRIDPWQPPPWESRDIWVDTQVDNDWDEYNHSDPNANPDVAGYPVGNGDRLRVNWPARVYARVWNDGDHDASNVKVNFAIVVPPGVGPGIGIGSCTIPFIAAGKFGLAMVEWTPSTSNGGHVCIQATIEHQPNELNALNNLAQENLTDWYVEGASPYTDVEFPFQVQNPLPDRAHFRIQTEGLKPGYHVQVSPVDFWLKPGEVTKGLARIHVDQNVGFDSDTTVATHEGERHFPPKVSLNFQVLYRCNWTPFGGISGLVHSVRKSSLKVETSVRDHPTEGGGNRELYALVTATNAQGAVKGANVTVRVMSPKHEVAILVHRRTDNQGKATIPLILPQHFSRVDDYRGEFVLSPTTSTGPADTELTMRFPG